MANKKFIKFNADNIKIKEKSLPEYLLEDDKCLDDRYYTEAEIDSKLSTYTPPEASSSTLGGIRMSYGTSDLTAGSSSLTTGALYFVYE